METKRVIALGFFDGVHTGHAVLMQRARSAADRLGVRASVLTFDLHPDTLIRGEALPLINSLADRQALITQVYHMDEMLVIHFTKAVQEQPWQEFVDSYLVRDQGAVHLVCGHDFRFGYQGKGTAQLLRERCRALGIGCDVIPAVTMDGVLVSSTYIRKLLQAGDMDQANRFLGHPHRLSGIVEHGRHLGTTIGTPTANLTIPQGVLCPAYGVYAARVTLADGSKWPAVTNVGVRPTVDENGGVTVESWLLGFDGDLYGQTILVEFFSRLRGEQKFPSLEALQEEIHKNARQALDLLGELI